MKACMGAALLACSLLCGLFQPRLQGQAVQTAPPIPKPDDRYKADILLVVAHPDDDTGITNYITRASLDQHKRVAVVFTTRGNSGGNAVGMEHAKAMADEREMEARHSLAVSGISKSGSCMVPIRQLRTCFIRSKHWGMERRWKRWCVLFV